MKTWIGGAITACLLIGCATDQRPEFLHTRKERAALQQKEEAEKIEHQHQKQRKIDAINAYLEANPNLDPAFVKAIKNMGLVRGMTKEQVVLSRGQPDRKNISVGSFGKHEQWVYGQRRYLYFENGILDSWQESY